MLPDLTSETENELNTRLTPRVIDRLRRHTFHARKIRCTNKETLPQAPTTERLPDPHRVREFCDSRRIVQHRLGRARRPRAPRTLPDERGSLKPRCSHWVLGGHPHDGHAE